MADDAPAGHADSRPSNLATEGSKPRQPEQEVGAGISRRTAARWPPGPPGYVLAAYLLGLRSDWLGALRRFAREYGDFVPLCLGPKRAVLLNHPELVKQVLVGGQHDFGLSAARRGRGRLLGQAVGTARVRSGGATAGWSSRRFSGSAWPGTAPWRSNAPSGWCRAGRTATCGTSTPR